MTIIKHFELRRMFKFSKKSKFSKLKKDFKFWTQYAPLIVKNTSEIATGFTYWYLVLISMDLLPLIWWTCYWWKSYIYTNGKKLKYLFFTLSFNSANSKVDGFLIIGRNIFWPSLVMISLKLWPELVISKTFHSGSTVQSECLRESITSRQI